MAPGCLSAPALKSPVSRGIPHLSEMLWLVIRHKIMSSPSSKATTKAGLLLYQVALKKVSSDVFQKRGRWGDINASFIQPLRGTEKKFVEPPTQRSAFAYPGLNYSALSGLNTLILKHFRKLQS